MGIVSIKIETENGREVFYAGERMSGFCLVETEGADNDFIVLKFCGNAHVYWTETKTSGPDKHRSIYTVSFTSTVEFFEMEKHLALTSGSCETTAMLKLPFSFDIPSSVVTSMEGTYGYIRYRLTAQPPGNWFTSLFKAKAARDLRILQYIDTNAPSYQFAVSGADEKTICCCCCSSGPLVVEAKIDRAAYCPNDTISISATFRNNSRTEVRPYVKLVQKKYFHADGETRITTCSWRLKHVGFSVNVIGEGGYSSWNGSKFRLPSVVPSINCGIIQVAYYVQVGLGIPWAYDLRVDLPIIIGTVPFREHTNSVTIAIERQPQTGSITRHQRWAGSGDRSCRPIATTPSLSLIEENVSIDRAPPDYFSTVFQGETATLSDYEASEKSDDK